MDGSDAAAEGRDMLPIGGGAGVAEDGGTEPIAGGAGTADAGSLIVEVAGVFNSVACPQWGQANSIPSYSGGYSICSPQDRQGLFFMPGVDTGVD